MSIAALIPVKSLTQVKTRLAQTWPLPERAQFVHDTARRIVAELRGVADLTPILLTPDDEVARWAKTWGIASLREQQTGHPTGLNQALDLARHSLTQYEALLIVPADLAWFGREDALAMMALAHAATMCVVIAPDRHGRGTNALLIKPPLALPLHYGEDSAHAHARAAQTASLPVYWYASGATALDVDHPDDLILFQAAPFVL
ncbi:MAG: 2-phospho-L-lactate guanylyltransferase [Anaerolineae bacterium]|nr:2-phospho-L-lactate guanylyltransferase [Anaerolineae bacterium]